MDGDAGDTTQLRDWIHRLDQGDEAALNELIVHFEKRLLRLAGKMLEDYPRVRRWEALDDLHQRALLRLSRALRDVKPSSSREFFGLAKLQLRRELLNLAERYHAHCSPSESPDLSGRDAGEPSTNEPGLLSSWAEFHRTVDTLPEPLREAFCLIWYDGLTQREAAEFLGVSVSLVKIRWRDARIALVDALPDRRPR